MKGMNFEEWKALVQKRREGMTHSEIHNYESQLGVSSQYDPEYGQTYTITYNVTGNFDASNLPTEIKSTKTLKLNIPIPYGAVGSVDANVAHTYENGVLTIQDVQQDVEIAINVGDVLYENAKLGDYLYDDWTFGPTQKAGYLGRCVGLATENEGKSVWCSPKSSSMIKWSTEKVDTELQNFPTGYRDFNGKANTEILLSLGPDKYPAAKSASEYFQGNGYLPACGEFMKYGDAIGTYISNSKTIYYWTSTEYSSDNAYFVYGRDGSGSKAYKKNDIKVTAFCQLSGKPSGNPKYNGHEYVEIGGLKWATMNVGATSETDAGLYFQWGDTQGYTADQVGNGEGQKVFLSRTDKFYSGDNTNPFTKYNSTDGKTVLDPKDDAAVANWGGVWRMPTKEDMVNLGESVNVEPVTNFNGINVNGWLCTDKTDSSKKLFFPATSMALNDCIATGVDSNRGYYLSSTRNDNWSYYATMFEPLAGGGFGDSIAHFDFLYSRGYGMVIRPIAS